MKTTFGLLSAARTDVTATIMTTHTIADRSKRRNRIAFINLTLLTGAAKFAG
jgi:hypothetical protein